MKCNFIFNEEHSQVSKRMENILGTSSKKVNTSANLKPHDPLEKGTIHPDTVLSCPDQPQNLAERIDSSYIFDKCQHWQRFQTFPFPIFQTFSVPLHNKIQ